MKNFDIWNIHKKNIEHKERIEYHEGDIWMVSVGENIGVEESGKGDNYLRPVVVIKKFNKEFSLCIPLSSTLKEGLYYFKFSFKQKISNALLSQIKPVDVKRFVYRMGWVNYRVLHELKTKTRNMIS